MRALRAPLTLVLVRARRRPGRWLLTALGIGIAFAFAGSVLAESTVAADRSARTVLAGLAPLDRAVRVTWQGVVTPSVQRRAVALIRQLGLGNQTEIVLMNPVRLGGVVVRPAAIAPLRAWITTPAAAVAAGRCGPEDCPMLLAGGSVRTGALGALNAPGVRVPIAGQTRLRSAVPLGFVPTAGSDQQPPLLIGGDAAGLESLPALSSVYRTDSWVAPLPTAQLHNWELAGTERRLSRAQAALLSSASEFSLQAPFAGLDRARAQADAAPRRLLLAGGGALAALVLFVILAAGGLRRDIAQELERLRSVGAHEGQCVAFVIAEAALLCGLAALIGAVTAILCGAVLADGAGLPAGGVLAHSLLTPVALAALAGGWVLASALVSTSLLASGGRLADVAAVAALAALVLALSLNRSATGNDPLPVLLAPLCCLAAGVLAYRAAGVLLQAGARVATRGPVLGRLALVGLARSPAAPSLAIAFIAVSTGLGGFALAYRATLLRGTADQAADRVPLDAIVAPGPDFRTPLELAAGARWQALTHGSVFPVRRTDATFVSGGAAVTVPALGVPGAALDRMRGWRAGDGSAPIATLARRLVPVGPARAPGPLLAPAARFLSLKAGSTAGVVLSAALRDARGEVRLLALGEATQRPRTLLARLPRGRWELEALALTQPAGLEVTNGHQNGENPGAATQQTIAVTLSSIHLRAGGGRALGRIALTGWRAVGAAGGARAGHDETTIRFSGTGATGLLRPQQPSDRRPVPVLVDSLTAAAAGRGGRLELTVDGEPVRARVAGVLARFPTLPTGAGGFVVADEQTLAGALDAQAPGQGRPDELWLMTRDAAGLRAALLRSPALAQLSLTPRADVQRRLASAPIARGVLGTLEAATALAGALAVLGLLVSLLGGVRDEPVERDLVAQGVGPRGLRRELQLRLLLAAALGVAIGLGVAALLTRLAVLSVRAATTLGVPHPPLVTVAPWPELVLWGLAALAALAAAGWIATRAVVGRRVST